MSDNAPERRVPVCMAQSPFQHLQGKISEEFHSECSEDTDIDPDYAESIPPIDRENHHEQGGFPLNKRNAGFKLSLMVNTVSGLFITMCRYHRGRH